MLASGFSWFRLIPAVDHDVVFKNNGLDEHSLAWLVGEGREVANLTTHLHAWLACVVLLLLALAARAALQRSQSRLGIERYFTDEKLTLLSGFEVFANGIRSLMGDLLSPKDVKAYFPLIAGLFAYIFVCNIQGIIPGFLPPTDNVNTNVGMALAAFLVFNYVGLSRDAGSYIGHLMGPVWWLIPLMLPLEVLSLMIRPISLTIRLTANLFGDHQVFMIISDLIPLLLPVGLLALAIMVSVVQAFVFSLLTTIYINLSLPHAEHEAH